MSDPLQAAIAHHQAGRLDQAEPLYRQLAERGTGPVRADALHLLGVIATQRGNPARAVELIEQALAVNPDTAVYYSNLAEAYRAAGQPDRAIEQARTAIRLAPKSAEAFNNLA